MSHTLTIWLPEALNGPWVWYKTAENLGRADTIETKQALATGDVKTVHVIVPGQWVRILDCDLPPMKAQELQSAVRFHIEAKIAAPIDSQHIIISGTQPPRAAIISQNKMEQIIAALDEVGLSPDGIYADFDCLKHLSHPIAVGDRTIYPQAGYTTDMGTANIGRGDGKAVSMRVASLFEKLDIKRAIDFRAGAFAKKRVMNFNIAQFSKIAALFLILGLSYLGLEVIKTRAVTQNADYFRAQARQLYEKTTGNPAPDNPALAVAKSIQTQSTPNAEFLSLSSILLTSISKVDGVFIDSLQFDTGQKQLRLRLIYPAFETASELENAVNSNGGKLDVGGVRESGGRFMGDAKLSGGAAP